MKDINIQGWRIAGILILVGMFSALAGCAAGGKPDIDPAADAEPSREAMAAPGSMVVERLADGREGFRIRETPGMDAESRRDFERAVVLLINEDYGQAIELLEKVVEGSPNVTAPYINLAIAYRHMDKSGPAEQYLKTALGLFPEHPLASNEYGLLLRKAGRFAEARAIYEKSLAVFPDYHPVRRNLGILCDLYLNDQACALEQYEIYSAAKPADEQVKIWIAELNARRERR